MNFSEAKEKLKQIADGEFHRVSYTERDHNDGEVLQECDLYIHGIKKIHSGQTWEEAFKKLDQELNGVKYLEGQAPEKEIKVEA